MLLRALEQDGRSYRIVSTSPTRQALLAGAVLAAEVGQCERSARLLGYADRWYETHTNYRDLNEQRSCAQTRALLASALSAESRDPLMLEGAGWTEDKAAEEALAI